ANVLSRFHIGLRRNGFLFLGASEHLGPFEDDYEPLNRQLRIYEKVRDSISLSGREIGASRIQLRDTVRTDSYRLPSQTWERGLLAHLIFTGFVVDEHGTLQQIYGDAPQYVNFKAGHVNLALTHVIHDDLSTPIRTGLFQAQKENKVVTFEQIAVSKGDNVTSVTIKISPFIIDPSTDESTRYYLIQLSEGKTVRKAVQPPGSSSPIEDLDRISGLERELAFTRESLQTTIEAVETTNEELQSSNEELIAANEELQSTNEELSSVNEELYTVNSEYQGQNQRLHRANQDMQNLLRSGGILAIFLDRKLRLRIITPGINDLFGLQEGDIGRPLLHFSTFAMIGNHRLENMMQAALEGTEQEETMTLIDGGTLHMKVLPYFEEDQTINGVVLYFVER
ncbi:MAG: PAS domain-containing protein, partial [Chloroflexota bacterium]